MADGRDLDELIARKQKSVNEQTSSSPHRPIALSEKNNYGDTHNRKSLREIKSVADAISQLSDLTPKQRREALAEGELYELIAQATLAEATELLRMIDSVEMLFEECVKVKKTTTKLRRKKFFSWRQARRDELKKDLAATPAPETLIFAYLQNRAKKEQQDERIAILEHIRLKEGIIDDLPTSKRTLVYRMIARGTTEPQPEDFVYEAAQGQKHLAGKAAAAVWKLLQCDQTRLTELRGELLFRQSIDKLDATYRVTDVPELSLETLELPRELNPRKEVRLFWGDDKKIAPEVHQTLLPFAELLRKRLKWGAAARNWKVRAHARDYALFIADVHENAKHKSLNLQQSSIAEVYEEEYGKSLRVQLFNGVDSKTRAECERDLGLAPDVASLVPLLQTDSAGAEKKSVPEMQDSLGNAMRLVLRNKEQTVSHWIWEESSKLVSLIQDKSGVDAIESLVATVDQAIAGGTGKRLAEVSGLKQTSIKATELLKAAAVDICGSLTAEVDKAGYSETAEKRIHKLLGTSTSGKSEVKDEQALFDIIATAAAASEEDWKSVGNALANVNDKTQKSYLNRYGITPHSHVKSLIAGLDEALARWKEAKKEADKEEQTFTTPKPLPASKAAKLAGIEVSALKEISAEAELPAIVKEEHSYGFTKAEAKERALGIWRTFHGQGKLGTFFATLYVGNDTDRAAIDAEFVKLSGGLTIKFYLRQDLNLSSDAVGRLVVGGQSISGNEGAASAALEYANNGRIGLLDKLDNACDMDNEDFAFELVEKATLAQRQAVLKDSKLMSRLRSTFSDSDWQRIHLGLQSRSSLYSMLMTRSDGWSVMEGGTDEDGMAVDIKRYFEMHPEAKSDAAALFGKSEIGGIIDSELSGEQRSRVQSSIIAAGEPDFRAELLSDGNVWGEDEDAAIKLIYSAPKEEIDAIFDNPALLSRWGDFFGSRKSHTRSINAALSAGNSENNDHYRQAMEGSWTTDDVFLDLNREESQVMRALLDMWPSERERLARNPSVMAKILNAFDDNPKQLAIAKQAIVSMAGNADVGAESGRLGKREKEIRYLFENARLRLAQAALGSWDTALRHLVEIAQFDLYSEESSYSEGDLRKMLLDYCQTEIEVLASKNWTSRILVDGAHHSDRHGFRDIMVDAVLRQKDPSHLRLSEQGGIVKDDFAEMKEVITNASDRVIISTWSNVSQPSADGRHSLAEEYAKYHRARSEGKSYEEIRQALTGFDRHVIDVSMEFERIALPICGNILSERTSTEEMQDVRMYRSLDNSQYLELRNLVRGRIEKLSVSDIANQLRTYGEASGEYSSLFVGDESLIDTPTRRAVTKRHYLVDKYVETRGEGSGAFDSDEGLRADLAMNDYMHSAMMQETYGVAGRGRFNEAQEKYLDAKAEVVTESLERFEKKREQVVSMWTAVLGLAITAIITICTAGTATGPALMALQWAMTMAISEAGSVIAKEAMLGNSFDASEQGTKDIMQSATLGAVTAGTSYMGHKMITALKSARTLNAQAAAVARIQGQTPPMWQIMAEEAGEEVFSETLATGFEAALAPIDPIHWMHGMSEGFDRAMNASRARIEQLPKSVVMAAVMPLKQVGSRMRFNRKMGAARNSGVAPELNIGGTVDVGKNLKEFFEGYKDVVAEALMEWGVGAAMDGHLDTSNLTYDAFIKIVEEAKEQGMVMHLMSALRNSRHKEAERRLSEVTGLSDAERSTYLNMVDMSDVTDPIPDPMEFVSAKNELIKSALLRHENTLTPEQRALLKSVFSQAKSTPELLAMLTDDVIAEILKGTSPAGGAGKTSELRVESPDKSKNEPKKYHELSSDEQLAAADLTDLRVESRSEVKGGRFGKGKKLETDAKVGSTSTGSYFAEYDGVTVVESEMNWKVGNSLAKSIADKLMELNKLAAERNLAPKVYGFKDVVRQGKVRRLVYSEYIGGDDYSYVGTLEGFDAKSHFKKGDRPPTEYEIWPKGPLVKKSRTQTLADMRKIKQAIDTVHPDSHDGNYLIRASKDKSRFQLVAIDWSLPIILSDPKKSDLDVIQKYIDRVRKLPVLVNNVDPSSDSPMVVDPPKRLHQAPPFFDESPVLAALNKLILEMLPEAREKIRLKSKSTDPKTVLSDLIVQVESWFEKYEGPEYEKRHLETNLSALKKDFKSDFIGSRPRVESPKKEGTALPQATKSEALAPSAIYGQEERTDIAAPTGDEAAALQKRHRTLFAALKVSDLQVVKLTSDIRVRAGGDGQLIKASKNTVGGITLRKGQRVIVLSDGSMMKTSGKEILAAMGHIAGAFDLEVALVRNKGELLLRLGETSVASDGTTTHFTKIKATDELLIAHSHPGSNISPSRADRRVVEAKSQGSTIIVGPSGRGVRWLFDRETNQEGAPSQVENPTRQSSIKELMETLELPMHRQQKSLESVDAEMAQALNRAATQSPDVKGFLVRMLEISEGRTVAAFAKALGKDNIRGLDQWMARFTSANKGSKDNHTALGAELVIVSALSEILPKDEYVAVKNESDVEGKSFDVDVVDESGKVLESIEVQAPQKHVESFRRLENGVKHALEKMPGLAEGAVPSAGIVIDLQSAWMAADGLLEVDSKGWYEKGGARKNIFIDWVETQLAQDRRAKRLRRVLVISSAGEMLAEISHSGDGWIVEVDGQKVAVKDGRQGERPAPHVTRGFDQTLRERGTQSALVLSAADKLRTARSESRPLTESEAKLVADAQKIVGDDLLASIADDVNLSESQAGVKLAQATIAAAREKGNEISPREEQSYTNWVAGGKGIVEVLSRAHWESLGEHLNRDLRRDLTNQKGSTPDAALEKVAQPEDKLSDDHTVDQAREAISNARRDGRSLTKEEALLVEEAKTLLSGGMVDVYSSTPHAKSLRTRLSFPNGGKIGEQGSHFETFLKDSQLLDGVIVQGKTVGDEETYSAPSIYEAALLQLYSGDDAEVSVHYGRPNYRLGVKGELPATYKDNEVTPVNHLASAIAGYWSSGVKQVKVDMTGASYSEALELMSTAEKRTVHLGGTLAAEFDLGTVFVDDSEETLTAHGAPVEVTDPQQIVALTTRLVHQSGWDTVGWWSKGAQFTEVVDASALADAVRDAHSLGLSTYVSGGVEASDIQTLVESAVDEIGIIRAASQGNGIDSAAAKKLVEARNSAESSALGRGALLLAEYDRAYAVGLLGSSQVQHRDTLAAAVSAARLGDNSSLVAFLATHPESIGFDASGGISNDRIALEREIYDAQDVIWELRQSGREATPQEKRLIAKAEENLRQGVRIRADYMPISTFGYREHQTLLSLADPGEYEDLDGHLAITLADNKNLDGLILHHEYIERKNKEVAPYQNVSLIDNAVLRFRAGTAAPVTVYFGHPNFNDWDKDASNAVNQLAASASAFFRNGTADVKVAMDRMSAMQIIELQKNTAAAVRRNEDQYLSAAFNLNVPVLDDRPETIKKHGKAIMVEDPIAIARLGIAVTAAGGWEKVTWDGASDAIPSVPFMDLINAESGILIELVHEAHSEGLETYISAGMRDHHMADAVYSGVDGVGIGTSMHAKNPDGTMGPLEPSHIQSALAIRTEAEQSIRGRGAKRLAQLDHGFSKGELDNEKAQLRLELYKAVREADESAIERLLDSELRVESPGKGEFSPTKYLGLTNEQSASFGYFNVSEGEIVTAGMTLAAALRGKSGTGPELYAALSHDNVWDDETLIKVSKALMQGEVSPMHPSFSPAVQSVMHHMVTSVVSTEAPFIRPDNSTAPFREGLVYLSNENIPAELREEAHHGGDQQALEGVLPEDQLHPIMRKFYDDMQMPAGRAGTYGGDYVATNEYLPPMNDVSLPRQVDPAKDGISLVNNMPVRFDWALDAEDHSMSPDEFFDALWESTSPDRQSQIEWIIDEAMARTPKELMDSFPEGFGREDAKRSLLLSYHHSKNVQYGMAALGYPQWMVGHDWQEIVTGKALKSMSLKGSDRAIVDWILSLDDEAYANGGIANPVTVLFYAKWAFEKHHPLQGAMQVHRRVPHHTGVPDAPSEIIERGLNGAEHHMLMQGPYGVRGEMAVQSDQWGDDLQRAFEEDPAFKGTLLHPIGEDSLPLMVQMMNAGKYVPYNKVDWGSEHPFAHWQEPHFEEREQAIKGKEVRTELLAIAEETWLEFPIESVKTNYVHLAANLIPMLATYGPNQAVSMTDVVEDPLVDIEAIMTAVHEEHGGVWPPGLKEVLLATYSVYQELAASESSADFGNDGLIKLTEITGRSPDWFESQLADGQTNSEQSRVESEAKNKLDPEKFLSGLAVQLGEDHSALVAIQQIKKEVDALTFYDLCVQLAQTSNNPWEFQTLLDRLAMRDNLPEVIAMEPMFDGLFPGAQGAMGSMPKGEHFDKTMLTLNEYLDFLQKYEYPAEAIAQFKAYVAYELKTRSWSWVESGHGRDGADQYHQNALAAMERAGLDLSEFEGITTWRADAEASSYLGGSSSETVNLSRAPTESMDEDNQKLLAKAQAALKKADSDNFFALLDSAQAMPQTLRDVLSFVVDKGSNELVHVLAPLMTSSVYKSLLAKKPYKGDSSSVMKKLHDAFDDAFDNADVGRIKELGEIVRSAKSEASGKEAAYIDYQIGDSNDLRVESEEKNKLDPDKFLAGLAVQFGSDNAAIQAIYNIKQKATREEFYELAVLLAKASSVPADLQALLSELVSTSEFSPTKYLGLTNEQSASFGYFNVSEGEIVTAGMTLAAALRGKSGTGPELYAALSHDNVWDDETLIKVSKALMQGEVSPMHPSFSPAVQSVMHHMVTSVVSTEAPFIRPDNSTAPFREGLVYLSNENIPAELREEAHHGGDQQALEGVLPEDQLHPIMRKFYDDMQMPAGRAGTYGGDYVATNEYLPPMNDVSLPRQVDPAKDGISLVNNMPVRFDWALDAEDHSMSPDEFFDALWESTSPDRQSQIEWIIDEAMARTPKELMDSFPEGFGREDAKRSLLLSYHHSKNVQYGMAALGYPQWMVGHDWQEIVTGKALKSMSLKGSDRAIVDWILSLDDEAYANGGIANPVTVLFYAKWAFEKHHPLQGAMQVHRRVPHHTGVPDAPSEIIERGLNGAEHHMLMQGPYGVRGEMAVQSDQWGDDLQRAFEEDPAFKGTLLHPIGEDSLPLMVQMMNAGKYVPYNKVDWGSEHPFAHWQEPHFEEREQAIKGKEVRTELLAIAEETWLEFPIESVKTNYVHLAANLIPMLATYGPNQAVSMTDVVEDPLVDIEAIMTAVHEEHGGVWPPGLKEVLLATYSVYQELAASESSADFGNDGLIKLTEITGRSPDWFESQLADSDEESTDLRLESPVKVPSAPTTWSRTWVEGLQAISLSAGLESANLMKIIEAEDVSAAISFVRANAKAAYSNENSGAFGYRTAIAELAFKLTPEDVVDVMVEMSPGMTKDDIHQALDLLRKNTWQVTEMVNFLYFQPGGYRAHAVETLQELSITSPVFDKWINALTEGQSNLDRVAMRLGSDILAGRSLSELRDLFVSRNVNEKRFCDLLEAGHYIELLDYLKLCGFTEVDTDFLANRLIPSRITHYPRDLYNNILGLAVEKHRRQRAERVAQGQDTKASDSKFYNSVLAHHATGVEIEIPLLTVKDGKKVVDNKLMDALKTEDGTIDGILDRYTLYPEFVDLIALEKGVSPGELKFSDFSPEQRYELITPRDAFSNHSLILNEERHNVFGGKVDIGAKTAVEVTTRQQGAAKSAQQEARLAAESMSSNNRSQSVHHHIPIRKPAQLTDQAALVEYYRRVELFLSLLTGCKKKIKPIGHIGFLSPDEVQEIMRSKLSSDQKYNMVGFRSGGVVRGNEMVSLELREWTKSSIGGALVEQMQRSVLTSDYGLDNEVLPAWTDGKSKDDISALFNDANYNKDIEKLFADAPEAIKELLAKQSGMTTLEEQLRKDSANNFGLKMLLHDWSKDPAIAGNSQMLQRIHDAQIKTLKEITPGKWSVTIVREFIEESGLIEFIGDTLGLDVAPGLEPIVDFSAE